MRLKITPFLISLVLLVGLLALVPVLLSLELRQATGSAWLGVLPGIGLGFILATCISEEQAGSRGLLLIPLSAALGMCMAILSWLFASITGDTAALNALGYGVINILGGFAIFGLIRKLYEIKLSQAQVTPIALSAGLPAALLLFLPLSPTVHGAISAAWVALIGLGVARIATRRKRGARSKS
jgi:hypothetical protein